jgi:hypothetical protein
MAAWLMAMLTLAGFSAAPPAVLMPLERAAGWRGSDALRIVRRPGGVVRADSWDCRVD